MCAWFVRYSWREVAVKLGVGVGVGGSGSGSGSGSSSSSSWSIPSDACPRHNTRVLCVGLNDKVMCFPSGNVFAGGSHPLRIGAVLPCNNKQVRKSHSVVIFQRRCKVDIDRRTTPVLFFSVFFLRVCSPHLMIVLESPLCVYLTLDLNLGKTSLICEIFALSCWLCIDVCATQEK